MSGICYIVGAGEETPLSFNLNQGDMIIACDGGRKYLEKYNYVPNLTVGDFDSLGYVPTGADVVTLNPIKDDTDVIAALKIAYDMGYENYRLYGCMGGDLSHTLANIQILNKLSRDGKKAVLIGKDCCMTAISDGSLVFSEAEGYISVFSPDTSYGVTLKGLKYPLLNRTLNNGYPIGVNNEFIGEQATVSVKRGTLIVVFSAKAQPPIFLSGE